MLNETIIIIPRPLVNHVNVAVIIRMRTTEANNISPHQNKSTCTQNNILFSFLFQE